jgi:hypothetical protein
MSMNIREISKPVTAKSLNETLARKFGAKINIDAFTLEQLQDARNRIRTKLSQVETMESFDSVHSNENYQKSKLFLDVLNSAIKERGDIQEAKGCPCNEPPGGKCTCPADCKDCDCKTNESKKAKPDYIDIDGDGDKKEPMKKAVKDKKKKKIGEADAQPNENDPAYVAIKKKYEEALRTGNRAMGRLLAGLLKDVYGEDPTVGGMIGQRTGTAANQGNAQPTGMAGAGANQGNAQPTGMAGAMADSIEESVVTEGAEDQAELVMASKDMVDRLTGWMEDTAEMQSESMLELADAIRDELGSEKSESFTAKVKPALEALYAAMEETRVALTSGVGMLTGEAEPEDMMGAEPADDMAPMEPPVDGEVPPMPDADVQDEFSAADAAVGGEEEAGRAKRESKQYSKKKIAENSKKLALLLSKKKS